MRNIGVVTVGRSDYGIYLPLLREINADPDLHLDLIVSGTHLSPEFGMTVNRIISDGFDISHRVEMLLSSDTPEGISKSIGIGILGFSQVFASYRPDILVVLGDRFEMYAAAIAAMPFNIPLAHIHGGESTEGLVDEAIRHSITKLSHLHFVSTAQYRKRVIQMGEEPWRVVVSGAPSLDNLHNMKLLSVEEIEKQLGFSIGQTPILVTFHPVTLEYDRIADYITILLSSIEEINLPIIFTYPNADTHGRVIIKAINDFVQSAANAHAVANLGTELYFSLMKHAAAMVGNSSSGIIEAASFGLPVVNIGNRQMGRVHDINVIDVPCEKLAIQNGILCAVSPSFKESLVGLENPYGSGKASILIIDVLRRFPRGEKLLIKHFYDFPEK